MDRGGSMFLRDQPDCSWISCNLLFGSIPFIDTKTLSLINYKKSTLQNRLSVVLGRLHVTPLGCCLRVIVNKTHRKY